MKIPTHLSYMRSLSPSPALFFYKTDESDFNPIEVFSEGINGRMSGSAVAYNKDGKLKNVTANDLGHANLHASEYCYVPPKIKEFYCKFSLTIAPNSLSPYICNDQDLVMYLEKLAQCYAEKGGYQELATRYAKNILNGLWLWRNKKSPKVDISVYDFLSEQEVANTAGVQSLSWDGNWGKYHDELQKLSKIIAQALHNNEACELEVVATIRNRFMQEIYPSQLLPEENKVHKQLATTRVEDGSETTCLGRFKVGAAIQIIDDWHGGDKPLRVSSYGSVPERLVALRTPSNKKDVYSLLPKIIDYINFLESNNLGENETSNEINYLMAMLVKGDVLGMGSEKKSK
ncbi:type I-F CRISPR-associated protein Csy3 [Parashewanella spongiae]|uniref:Type I-F CRISPR-associated protein Csy3 n=1 Tax=Parashewanella spongiae TaxID=342950 RepID=A0A3A6U149_9GAMM|nr:type I-F CRISPR-associated protein Csy3 [Parashewanella spongiae]MCL1076916.1 type I-F CRISPR-associated protein Csy3 [Parashewanella spongiae]RJY19165.1 type I-F CRISPR-associated protein Csy3 [Parashewanella spongiae]USN27181.1 type I-F CRISPR-associated protein Csy3/Cas7 [synthetic construct]